MQPSLQQTLSPPIPFEKRTSLRLPLFGTSVEAGFPSPADDYLKCSLDLNERLVRHPSSTFFVRAKGASMRDAGINDGALLVVDRSITPSDGQIVVAMLDGQFTLKRLRKRKGQLFLEAENPDFLSIEINGEQELVIWGVVKSATNEFA
jgi:DNA polymerase V